ncbi:MAG TPA: hypothetical protein VGV37_04590 [Aliidongia sp.]|uniref:hypothetical protein n=1 Tax=Aliidongia sp. TaxID=1914230 RepID=UPI002DDD2843|nr:hypothetical protein [Aliidongia sp.]HEV2673796.1 hypothetical protein [Aliidongia sp.]
MNPILKHLHRLARTIRRVLRRLGRRHTTVDVKLTLALPPFLKVELDLKNEAPKPANDRPAKQSA